jgi:hypothetical protein
MTRDEIIADLRTKYPVMKSGNDTDGYIEFTSEEYEAQINIWADYLIEEAEIKTKAEADKVAAEAKLAALGLTADDLKALGLGSN